MEGLIVENSSKIAPIMEENGYLQSQIKLNQDNNEKEKNILKQ